MLMAIYSPSMVDFQFRSEGTINPAKHSITLITVLLATSVNHWGIASFVAMPVIVIVALLLDLA